MNHAYGRIGGYGRLSGYDPNPGILAKQVLAEQLEAQGRTSEAKALQQDVERAQKANAERFAANQKKGKKGAAALGPSLLDQLPSFDDILGTSAEGQDAALAEASAATNVAAGQTTKLIAGVLVVGALGIGAVVLARRARKKK